MPRLRWIGVLFGLLIVSLAQAQTQNETDLQTLRAASKPTDAKGLLTFFKSQSLEEADAKHLPDLVRKLGSDVYSIREPAAKELVAKGPKALPFLKASLASSPLELKRRAELCVRDIEALMQSEVITAAARVLAQSKDPKAAEVLFNFLPSISTDPNLEEEVLSSVGRLTVLPDKIDPLVFNSLKDPLASRRLAAAYLIGRRAGAAERVSLRSLLADPDERVRQRVAEGLFGKRPPQMLAEALVGDEKLLRDQKIEPTEPDLLAFFRKRTLSVEDQQRFRNLVKKLGSTSHLVRDQATREFIKEGTPVLAFLKEAAFDTDTERSRRARMCLEQIRQENITAVPIAAAHLLARSPQKKDASPGEAIRALLAYVPFADDEAVEDEILLCLTILSLREPAVELELLKALDDPSPVRRGAAAFVLGHVGVKEQVAKVLPLLDDAHPVTRLRAAQGLLAARNMGALPSFVGLLKDIPAPYLPRVEEILYRLADDKGPNESIHASAPESRLKAAKVWGKWLDDNRSKIDLTNLNDRDVYLGLITICEYDNQVGNIQGQISEAGRSGPKRWSFGGVMGAMDAHTLPNGRVLVAENSGNRVTERDNKGVIKWEYRTPTNPICCQRLPNGNTFIASYNMVMEVRPDKTEVYRISPGPQFYMFSAHKAKNGHIAAITAQGQIIEMDTPTQGATAAKIVNTVQAQTLGNWCSVELQPNGNYLVASMNPNNGVVREFDRKGTEVWNKSVPGAFRATKLPNGNVVVASMTTRQVTEIDRAGTTRWSVTCTGRPWGVHYR